MAESQSLCYYKNIVLSFYILTGFIIIEMYVWYVVLISIPTMTPMSEYVKMYNTFLERRRKLKSRMFFIMGEAS